MAHMQRGDGTSSSAESKLHGSGNPCTRSSMQAYEAKSASTLQG